MFRRTRAMMATVMFLGPVATQAADALQYGGQYYQHSLIDSARAQAHLKIDPNPEGKTIERIVIVPYEVFLEQEPYPLFLNWFHITTRSRVIERELLFKAGDRWSNDLVNETARNLRNYLYLTSGQIVAAQGSSSDRVVALVVTKDTWSLRLNTNFSYVGSKLELLEFQLAENNLAGLNKQTIVDFGLNLASWYTGERFRDPRLFGSELLLNQRMDLIVNRTSGKLEGGVTNFSVEQPLYTLDTPWAWVAAATYRKDIYRLFSLGNIALYVAPTTGESLLYSFNREQLDIKVGGTRSTGHEHKRDFSAGYRAFVHNYSVSDLSPSIQPATVADFTASALPRTESAGILYGSFHMYEANFKELLDIQSFAISEDYRLGLNLSSEFRLASRLFGFTSTFAEPSLSADWTWLRSDDLFTVGAGVDVRYQPEAVPGLDWADGNATFRIRNVSPRLAFLRLHNSLRLVRRYNDLDHSFDTLGGDSSLRGYPSAYLRGANLWVGNVEARTMPLAFATLHFGLAGFLDVGGASDSFSNLGAHGSAGLGLRIGLPQFDREVLRIDYGVPFESIVGASPAYIVAQYGQAF